MSDLDTDFYGRPVVKADHSEKIIQAKVVAYARKKKMLVMKFVSQNNRGVPDYIFLYNGFVFFIEFKATGKKTRMSQDVKIKAMRDQGADVYVCDDIDTGKRIIDNYIGRVNI